MDYTEEQAAFNQQDTDDEGPWLTLSETQGDQTSSPDGYRLD